MVVFAGVSSTRPTGSIYAETSGACIVDAWEAGEDKQSKACAPSNGKGEPVLHLTLVASNEVGEAEVVTLMAVRGPCFPYRDCCC